MENDVYYPMAIKPSPDEGDGSFSKTVIIFSDDLITCELGYFDFDQDQWYHFGQNDILLKCWCYIPFPLPYIYESWHALKPKGYIKPLY
jgi:hypothetical protein